VPALDARRVQEVLPHVAALEGDLIKSGLRQCVVADEAHDADDVLGRVLDLGVVGPLRTEEGRQE
jgi:hypothetical protein